MNKNLLRLIAAAIALALFASACGSGSSGTETSTADEGDTEEVDTKATAEAEKAEADAAADDEEMAEDEGDMAEDEADHSDDDSDMSEEEGDMAEDEGDMAEDEGDAGAASGDAMTASVDVSGTTVTVTGPERSEEEAAALQYALDQFATANDMEIFYIGSADWEAEINIQIEAGNAPDISVFPQPGKLADFARAGNVIALPDDVTAAAQANWSDSAMAFGNVDGTQYGVPNKSDVKSLVWYMPERFEEAGYEIPTSLDDLWALSDQMIADGNTPWCVGIESGQATGWPFTDWVEDLVLRRVGPEGYDQWVSGEKKFSDPDIAAAMQEVLDQWNKEGAVYSEAGTIAATAFQDNGEPLVNGDCMMHRQASFFSAFLPEGTPAGTGEPGSVDVFYFPAGDTGNVVLSAGTLAGAFADRPEVWEVMKYIGSADYANFRQEKQKELKGGGDALSGFNTANLNADSSLWAPLEQSFQQIMADAEALRFDGSDLMPADVGAGTFWTEGTAMVSGEETVEEGAAKIDASWPQ